MKTMKLIILFLIITFNSGCFFLENVIPPDWYAEDETNNTLTDIPAENVVYPEYVWVSHVSGIQCEVMYFETLFQAVNHLRTYNIEIYDQKEHEYAVRSQCGTSNGKVFTAKINRKDLYKLQGTLWHDNTPR